MDKIFKKIVIEFGSQAELSRKLGITSMAISRWKIMGRIPLERALEIQKLSNKRILFEEIIEANRSIKKRDS